MLILGNLHITYEIACVQLTVYYLVTNILHWPYVTIKNQILFAVCTKVNVLENSVNLRFSCSGSGQ